MELSLGERLRFVKMNGMGPLPAEEGARAKTQIQEQASFLKGICQ